MALEVSVINFFYQDVKFCFIYFLGVSVPSVVWIFLVVAEGCAKILGTLCGLDVFGWSLWPRDDLCDE
jgi:hypothetical protein